MKLFAQHGSLGGSRLVDGLKKKLVNGVIFSLRDISHEQLASCLSDLQTNSNHEFYIDPQYYVCSIEPDGARLGYLAKDYRKLIPRRRRFDLTIESNIREDLRRSINFQNDFPVSGFISPNILVARSFDSREAAISIDFVRLSKEVTQEINPDRPLFATLALSHDALRDRRELEEFAHEITAIQDGPEGFYILVHIPTPEARADLFHEDVIAGWMYLNHCLSLNGKKVINGYSDLLTPLLGISGAHAGATGWWGSLRNFSLARFRATNSRARAPIERYLSLSLWNRVRFDELDQLRNLVPEVLNDLKTDECFNEDQGSQPDRTNEVLQSWEALKTLNQKTVASSPRAALDKCRALIKIAKATYLKIRGVIRLDPKSNDDHLEALENGLDRFQDLAEL